MSKTITMTLVVLACLCGASSAGIAIYLAAKRRLSERRRERGLAAQGVGKRNAGERGPSGNAVLRYAESLSRRLFTGSAEPLSPSVRAGRAAKTRSGRRFLERARAAGCSETISVEGFCETQLRLTLALALPAALVGALLSTELAIVAALVGGAVGRTLPLRSVKRLAHDRGICAGRYLSEMLEVVALGLRSGLTFDKSFELYGSHFDNEFARECAQAYRKWSLGLATREDALRALAASFECKQLARIVDTILRSLRFGSSVTELLEDAAAQSRATYRAALEERVAKAPVKMMLPTGALILPAMLLMVMGPVLLELAGSS